MSEPLTATSVMATGPRGCPVIHGLNPLDPALVRDPGGYTALARAEAPVFFVPEMHAYMVTKYADVARVTSDWKTFRMPPLGAHQVPPEVADRLTDGFIHQRAGFAPALQPPEHGRVRKLAQKAFTRSTALATAPRIRALCNSYVDRIIDAGQADLLTEYAKEIPVRVIATILGVDLSEAPRMYQWAQDILRLLGDHGVSGQELVDIANRHADLEEWGRALIAGRRANPRGETDLISNLLRARSDDDTPRLSDLDILSIIVAAIFGGSDTSAGAIAQVVHRMLEGDRQLYHEALADRSLVPNLLEEELRFHDVGISIFRMATVDTELSGIPIPAGSVLALHTWSTGHDEDVFDDPERFDARRADLDRHLGWGRGIHFCLGAPLAKVEVATAVEVLLDRLPNMRLVDGHEIQRTVSVAIPSLTEGLVVAWDPPAR
jgi:cytochrome P450